MRHRAKRPAADLLKKVLKGAGLLVLLISILGFYYTVIIASDDPDTRALDEVTAPPMAQLPQERLVFRPEDLAQARYYFSMPLLTLGYPQMTLESVTVSDVRAPSGRPVRTVTLQYRLDGGDLSASLSSLWPAADALASIADGELTLAASQDLLLAGLPAVGMRSGDLLHAHAQQGDILYQAEASCGEDSFRTLLENTLLDGTAP